jgi:hypothetical protein
MELKHINGRNIIDLLNSKEEHIEDLKDETCYYHFEYEEECIKDNNFILNFTIDSDYVIRGNRIYIDTDGKVDSRLEEPFDSGGQYGEIEDILNFV